MGKDAHDRIVECNDSYEIHYGTRSNHSVLHEFAHGNIIKCISNYIVHLHVSNGYDLRS